jgi:outer membrane biosynthesis protein TonB
MRLTILLLCGVFLLGQSSSPPDQKSQNAGQGETGTHGRLFSSVDVLSDTQGVDFGPYLQRVLENVRKNWRRAIPESAERKHGKVVIEFTIAKDGEVRGMTMVPSSGKKIPGLNIAPSSGDVDLDRAAWAGITVSDPFPPLPSDFTGTYLALRFRFYYNPDESELSTPSKSPH